MNLINPLIYLSRMRIIMVINNLIRHHTQNQKKFNVLDYLQNHHMTEKHHPELSKKNHSLSINKYTKSDISARYINYKYENMTTDNNKKCEAHSNPMFLLCDNYISKGNM